jgi:LPXTG-motif cell wall-anchored protein
VSEADEQRKPDFVDRALQSFDHALDVVHDKVLRPLLIVGRAIAFGFIVLLAALVLICVLVIGVIRLLNVYLFAGHEWLSYAIIGVLFLTAGLLIWRRRRPVNLRKK